MRDRFYNQIVQGLAGALDPELFERCVTDILRQDYPGLVPITGGSDAGVDGLVADGEEEPFPLVATTGKDVIGNLTHNLNSYVQSGNASRKVLLATSQKLSPKRVRNLFERARELGFTLVNVYSQDALANLLYESPRWCKELLGLSGAPPPLSVLPKTARPFLDIPLVGRDEDKAWLEQTTGDRLLVGQPGIGKTFLLRKFAVEGGGLFVVGNDRAGIAESLRSERPNVVIVDDAHASPDLLLDLKHLREETGARFSIIASSWPGDEHGIAQMLGLAKPQVHHLDLLTMDQMVEVVKATGLLGPPQLIQEIVNQAEGRPGLAVTLVDLCRKGALDEIARGDALSRSVLSTFQRLVGPTVTPILAAFALGGDSGMPMGLVADVLEVPQVDLWDRVTKLAAGGVVLEVKRQLLSVRPPALRHALVRDAFFGGATSLPVLERLVAEAPDKTDVVLTLIGASARGAAVPQSTLQRMLEEVDAEEAWAGYAWLGREQATWVLTNHPEKLLAIAQATLHHIPEVAIPMLLDKAEGDGRQLHSTPEHPLRLVQDWAQSGRPGTGEPVSRRRAVLNGLRPRLSWGIDAGVTVQAIRIVLSPGYQEVLAEPGSGNEVTIHYGCISMDEMWAVRGMWAEIREALKALPVEKWGPLRDMIEDWAYSGRMNVQIPAEMHEAMREFALEMLHDIVATQTGRPSVAAWASGLATHLRAEGFPLPDADFLNLFPGRDLNSAEHWREVEARQVARVQEMAAEWSLRDPHAVAKRLAYLEEEARIANLAWPRWTPILCEGIAQQVASRLAWARALMGVNAGYDLVAPFLRAAYGKQDPEWAKIVEQCLSHGTYRWAAIPMVLALGQPPEGILMRTLSSLSGAGELIKILCLRGEVPVETLSRLLKHDDPLIAAAAASGEWNVDPRSSVRQALLDDWREAVRRASDDNDYWLGEVFVADPSLAYEWLRRRLPEHSPTVYRRERAVSGAIGVLDTDQRRSLLQMLDKDSLGGHEMVFRLVGNDLDLYRELLADEGAKAWHLVPLSGTPEDAWIEKARLALDARYEPREIARAAYGYPVMTIEWVGKESAKWSEWASKFESLLEHEDQRIRSVGEAGKEIADRSIPGALEEERDEEVYGIGRRRRHL